MLSNQNTVLHKDIQNWVRKTSDGLLPELMNIFANVGGAIITDVGGVHN